MKLVFLYCEGAHDVALLRRVLPSLPGVRESSRVIKDYPRPFNDFWCQQLKEITAGALARPAEHRGKLAPPWLEAMFEGPSVLYLLFDMGGKDQRPRVKEMLDAWLLLRDSPFGGPVDVETWAAVMVVDADDEGTGARLHEVFQWYRDIGVLDALPAAPSNPHWMKREGFALGGIVVHAPGGDKGAVEDLWMPIAEGRVPERLTDARAFIDKHKEAKSKIGKEGWTKKATLTIAGQIEHPNDSLAVILRQTQWASDQDVAQLPFCQTLLRFLSDESAFGSTPERA